jgi:hypothetical protein
MSKNLRTSRTAISWIASTLLAVAALQLAHGGPPGGPGGGPPGFPPPQLNNKPQANPIELLDMGLTGAYGPTGVVLTWASPDPKNALVFDVLRAGVGPNGAFGAITPSRISATTFTDPGPSILAPTTVSYKVMAYFPSGLRAVTNPVAVSIPPRTGIKVGRPLGGPPNHCFGIQDLPVQVTGGGPYGQYDNTYLLIFLPATPTQWPNGVSLKITNNLPPNQVMNQSPWIYGAPVSYPYVHNTVQGYQQYWYTGVHGDPAPDVTIEASAKDSACNTHSFKMRWTTAQ